MASSGAEPPASALTEIDGAFAQAALALGTGDLAATSAAIERADVFLAAAGASGRAFDPAVVDGVRRRHAQLLATVLAERDRVAAELGRLRAAHRALRSYRARSPRSAGRQA